MAWINPFFEYRAGELKAQLVRACIRAIEEFWKFQSPQDIVDEKGYPQLTEQAKRKILGENLAKLHGMDVEATKARLGVTG